MILSGWPQMDTLVQSLVQQHVCSHEDAGHQNTAPLAEAGQLSMKSGGLLVTKQYLPARSEPCSQCPNLCVLAAFQDCQYQY